ncbi:MAG: hypothetical protein J3K34DRAFT_466141 [Monoraphidium minutum]|nr:MAG: hypothetical protein J3K34DRAFT_466141 [Monoraphidium minutum]
MPEDASLPPPQQPPAASPSGGAVGGLLRALRAGLSSGADALGLPRCAGCGAAAGLPGESVVTAQGRSYHPACFACAGCGRPLLAGGGGGGTFVPHQESGGAYHPECYRQRFDPRCGVCRELIPQSGAGRIEWSYHPFWKDFRYCPAHNRDGTPPCCACGRLEPRGAEWVVLQDGGRHVCLECLGTIVVDTRDAQPLYKEVLEFFRVQGMPHPYPPPLLLVESSVLEDHASRETGRRRGEDGPVFHVRGLCVATVYTSIPAVMRIGGGFGVNSIQTALARGGPLPPGATQRVSVQSLLVLYGLPRLLCGSIVAHELTHAWIRMQNVASIDPHVEEGLCQLMAYLWLEAQDHGARAAGPGQERLVSYFTHQIRTDTSPIYGDGFRRALELYQVRGLRALFDHVLRHKAWPAWHA